MFDLSGKIAVVTGGASGIGAATAERFAQAGATVVIGDVADASDRARTIGGRWVRTDVSVESEVKALMEVAAQTAGRIDICVNNVGVGSSALLVDAALGDFERAFRINTLSTLFGMRHAAAHMPEGGAIVNTASIAGVVGYPGLGAYSASKFAVVGLTRIAALELGTKGIRVNCVCPTSVNTPMLAAQRNGASEVATFDAMGGIRNLVEPKEVAAAMHFLVSDDCPVVSGHSLVLDGGVTAGVSPSVIELASSEVALSRAMQMVQRRQD